MVADDGLDPEQRAAAEQQVGCIVGTLTASDYQDVLRAAGFTDVSISPASRTVPGVRSAIIQASRPSDSSGGD